MYFSISIPSSNSFPVFFKQQLQLFFLQDPAAAAFQSPQKQISHCDPLQTPYFQSEEACHTPDLPILSLGKYKFIAAVSQNTDLPCPQKIPLICNTFSGQKTDLLL